jgi:CBS domain-containing protein
MNVRYSLWTSARQGAHRSIFTKEEIMVTVDQLMAKRLVSIEACMSTMEAAKLMKTHKVGSVLVKREHRIVGIVTESDIIRKVISTERIPYYVPVEEVMSSPIIGIEGRRPITEAAETMNQHGTRHLAVIDGGSIVGVVSVRDLLHPVAVDAL